MRIVYTHDIFTRQNVGGISRYFVELIRHLAEEDTHVRVFAGTHANRHLQELEGHVNLMGQFRCCASWTRIPRQVRNRVSQARYFQSANANIVHHTYYSFSRPLPNARMIVTVHDLIPERFPKQFGWKGRLLMAAKRRTCSQADRILAISETTKRDLVDRFNISPDVVDVAYLGNSLSIYAHELDDAPSEIPYILYVGARDGYKNCKTLWEAYSRSVHLKKYFRIDCFGGGAFTSEERALLDDLKISHLVRQCGGDDRTLAQYYRRAAVLVYPSLYEGFGFPPIEAMSFGCPVIVSTGGSIPEVVGPAGVYFDPRDCDMLTKTMESLLFDETAKDALRAQVIERAAQFRWQQTAHQTLECYRKAAA